MTNGNDVARAKHLESTAVNVKRYVLGEILDLSQAIVNDISSLATNNDVVLDTVASTVDGGLWYETTSTAPIIKFKQGGSTYYLYTNQLVSPNLTLSSSTVTATSGASQTITLTYSGEGTITLSNPNETALTASYNASTKTITLTSNLTSGDDPATVNLGIALSEAGNYAADSQTLAVTCTAQLLDPQLTLSTYTTNVGHYGSATVTVSYLGTGTISVQSDFTDAITASYNSNTKTITLSNQIPVSNTSATITVSLSASPGYASATATITNSGGGGK